MLFLTTSRQPAPARAFLIGATLLLVLTHFPSTALRAQQPNPRPEYIPPVCQGRSLTRLTREEMLAQTATAPKPHPPIAPAEQLRLFNSLVEIIGQNYVYPDFNGLNWPGIVGEVRRKVEAGLNTEAFYSEMAEFVKRLGDQHSYFESPVVAAANKAALAGSGKYVGIGALLKPLPERKRVTILAVMPDSPAEHAGLRQHDSIIAVDGLPLIEDGKVYQLRTRGPECSAAVLTIASPGQSTRAVTLVRYQVDASMPLDVRLVKTSDGARIGYIFLPSFFDATLPEKVRKALLDFGALDGLILDNRMNGGGAASVMKPILGYFAGGTIGHSISRTGRQAIAVTANPVNNSLKVPLVILVSQETVSYAEVFTGVLRDIGRARVVGQTTAGRVEILHGYSFPDGSGAWIAQESFAPVNSRIGWRKSGVRPDVEVFADWDTFTFDNDPGVAAAVKLLGHK